MVSKVFDIVGWNRLRQVEAGLNARINTAMTRGKLFIHSHTEYSSDYASLSTTIFCTPFVGRKREA